MNMEHWCNENRQEKGEELGGKPNSLPNFHQKSHVGCPSIERTFGPTHDLTTFYSSSAESSFNFVTLQSGKLNRYYYTSNQYALNFIKIIVI
jgi:hypothetical protein